MDVALMILYTLVVLGLIVFVHEGGHYLAARAFGVRVTELMLGMPGPNIGFTKWGTKFGVTPILLGGYAKVCGMEPGEMSPHLEPVLASIYRRGTANMEDVALDCDITPDEAYEALEELVEWGSVTGPTKKDEFNTYRTPELVVSKKEVARALEAGKPAPVAYAAGEARPVDDPHAFFESEYRQQYRSLPFWKRSVILVAGVAVNLVTAMILFVLAFSVFGVDVVDSAGATQHVVVGPLQSLQIGFGYIGAVVQAVIGLFNPATVAETVSNSSSVVGIAVMSKSYADAGLAMFLLFIGMISVSVGIMNLLPIPPLDGGRFVVEVYQKLSRRVVSLRALNGLSLAGMALFVLFFLVMVNQDIQRFVFGNWG